jgi:hypothetical protein
MQELKSLKGRLRSSISVIPRPPEADDRGILTKTLDYPVKPDNDNHRTKFYMYELRKYRTGKSAGVVEKIIFRYPDVPQTDGSRNFLTWQTKRDTYNKSSS